MPRGVYDRTGAASPRQGGGRKPTDPNSLVGKLDSCKDLARAADRLEARAKDFRKKADEAGMAAGEARDKLAEKMRELTGRGLG